MSEIPLDRPKEAWARNILRLLGMVHELHKQGYQHLRIHSGLAPSGCYWRCAIFPKGLSPQDQDRYYQKGDPDILVARYTSGDEKGYFGWDDCAQDDARHLAIKFLGRFPKIAGMGRGRDWAYTGWFTELLGIAEHGRFPISFWDPMTENAVEMMNKAVWLSMSPGEDIPFPLPPPKGTETDY